MRPTVATAAAVPPAPVLSPASVVSPAPVTFSPAPSPISSPSPSPTPVVAPAVLSAPADTLPTRQPTRKIFGPDNKVITLTERRPATSSPSAQEATSAAATNTGLPTAASEPDASKLPHIDLSALAIPEPVSGRSIDIPLPAFVPSSIAPAHAAPAAAIGRVSWNDLPSSLDQDVRKKISRVQEQCKSAASSPFPFAKFISALPIEVCALQFAALLLDLEPNASAPAIAAKLGGTSDTVEALQAEASSILSDLFAQKCPVMYRNWKAQLAGRVVAAQTLIEQHLLGAVDRDFQLLIAQVILRAFGIKPIWAPSKAAQG